MLTDEHMYKCRAIKTEVRAEAQPPVPCPDCNQFVTKIEEMETQAEINLNTIVIQNRRIAEQSAEFTAFHNRTHDHSEKQSALIKELTETRDALLETQRALCNQAYERYMLIEKCEKFAADIPGNGSLLGFVSESARIEVLAAIAAHRKGPA